VSGCFLLGSCLLRRLCSHSGFSGSSSQGRERTSFPGFLSQCSRNLCSAGPVLSMALSGELEPGRLRCWPGLHTGSWAIAASLGLRGPGEGRWDQWAWRRILPLPSSSSSWPFVLIQSFSEPQQGWDTCYGHVCALPSLVWCWRPLS
jgi:hypothetical protein